MRSRLLAAAALCAALSACSSEEGGRASGPSPSTAPTTSAKPTPRDLYDLLLQQDDRINVGICEGAAPADAACGEEITQAHEFAVAAEEQLGRQEHPEVSQWVRTLDRAHRLLAKDGCFRLGGKSPGPRADEVCQVAVTVFTTAYLNFETELSTP